MNSKVFCLGACPEPYAILLQVSARVGSGLLIAGTLFSMLAVAASMDGTESSDELLRQARLNREVLASDFPGFKSQLRVHSDGVVHEGSMLFRPPITLELELDDADLRKEVKRTVRSLLAHRMASEPSSDETTRLGPADRHPLGRKVLLRDKYESSYRIRDNRILEVDRNMKDQTLIISVLDTQETVSGRYLPTSFFVTVFEADSGAMKSASAYTDTYKLAGKDYVPSSRRIISSANGRTRTLLVEWEDLQLLPPTASE